VRLAQHFELLLREERSLALRAAIHRVVVPGLRVLDAGCGTGLLSIWAAQLGARVVGVDTIDLSLARELAVANDVAHAIEFVRGDLSEVALAGPFDVVMAMLYHNDPRRDEEQSLLAAEICERHLRAGGEPIPDAVRYSARGFSWPEQDTGARRRRFDESCGRLEKIYGIHLGPLAEAVKREPDPSFFPRRRPDGGLESAGALPMTESLALCVIDYRTREGVFPEELTLRATARGTLHAVVWTQELVHRGTVLFRNESLSWVFPAPRLDAGDRCELAADVRWQRTNVLTPRCLSNREPDAPRKDT
jgi:SAM-dependent methyltransferase